MKLAIDAERWKMGIAGLAVLLGLLTIAIVVSAQVPESLVRGSFSDGNGSWDAESFGWFYYDLDEGAGSERLTVEAEGRRVKEGHLVYSSDVWTEEFDFEEWGRYQAVAFLGKRYLAGYLESNFTEAVSALEEGELREVLIDYDGVQTATSETPLYLNDGYWLEVAGASPDGKEVYLILKKNGMEADRAVVRLGETYVYEVGDDDIPVILAHVSAAMQGVDKAIVDFNGIFQVRDQPTIKLETGDLIGLMEVATLSEGRIELENAEDLVLRRDSTTVLVGNLMLRVRDNPSLVYYPLGAITEYGVHEIRGPVYSERSQVPISTAIGEFAGYAQARWNDENFSGFYFDDDKKIGSETLIIHKTDGRNIKPITVSSDRMRAGIEYTCFVHDVDFEFDPWGSYQVLCFLGDAWFVGYGPGAKLDVEDNSMLEHEQIGLVLIDTDHEDTAVAGDFYFLGEGYSLYIRDVVKDDVKKDEIFIELRKNDQLMDSAVIQSNSTYVYEKDVGDVEDLPIIALHVESIFSDGDDQFAIIDGLFQVSDSQFLSIEAGDELGELVVLRTGGFGIYMGNLESISLKPDSKVAILPGMSIKVADNDTLRYYIYKNEYILPPPEIVDYYLPDEPIPSGGLANFSVFVLAGDIKSVTAETVDSEGRRVILGDLKASGVGARDQWLYSWQWNATVPALSDDGTILPVSDVQVGALQINNSTESVQVTVNFDESGLINLIKGSTGEIYYISPVEYEKLGAAASYAEMASNETLRKRYIKIEQGTSEIRFFTVVEGSAVLSETSHKLWFSLQGLFEPHLVRVGAPPGRYEVRLRAENAMDALQVTGLYFDVSGPQVRFASVGSAKVQAEERFSLPLEIPASENETQMTLTFDPDFMAFEGVYAKGECDVETYLSKEGEIGLDIPGNCSAINLTFRAGKREGLSEVGISEIEGIDVDELENGSVNVTLQKRPEGTREKKIPAPGAVVALAAAGIAVCLAERRRR